MKNRGFTLIEMMIVVAVIGIIAAIAVPSYSDYIRRARRADAQSVLMQAAQYYERIYTECNDYTLRDASTTPSPCTTSVVFPASLTVAPMEGTPRYNITSVPASQSYVVQAKPIDTADACGTFVISSDGTKSLIGATLAVADCWRR